MMTERKSGVDEEMEWVYGQGGGQNQPDPLWELAANSRTPAANHTSPAGIRGRAVGGNIAYNVSWKRTIIQYAFVVSRFYD